jgi:RNA polymerase sigma-70 factor (ECF subfamily)
MGVGMTEAGHDSLDDFLAGVERRALRMAEIATRNRDEALDLVQDAMLQFVRSYRDRPAAERAPLFYRVLENRITDWHRSRTSRGRWWGWLGSANDDEETAADEYAAVPGADSENPLHALQRGSAMNRLENALQRLPQRQQQAFLLRIWEGLDVGDTASAMGCSEGSVKTHLSRALHSLRSELGEEWP